MLKANYHTHTELCGHAIGKAKDYIDEAIKLGFSEIGISDHAHTPKYFMSEFDYERNGLNQIMTDEKFEKIYIKDVQNAKKEAEKISDIKVFLGLETEYFKEHHDYFLELRKKVDYLVFGLHFFNYDGKIYSSYEDIDETTIKYYTETAIQGMSSGLYTIFAHPDLFMYDYHSKKGERVFDDACKECAEKIIEAAIKYDVYLEVNANGIQNTINELDNFKEFLYPRTEFWKIVKESKAKIIIGADAHKPSALGNDIVNEAISFTKKLKLNVCDFAVLKNIP